MGCFYSDLKDYLNKSGEKDKLSSLTSPQL